MGSKTFFLWLLALSVQTCYGFIYNDYKHLQSQIKRDTNLTVSTRWINQRLDNFNPADTRTWRMRYFENLDFYRQGGPILLYIGGEAEMKGIVLQGGLIVSFAREVGGALFASEHRFYGQSVPNGNFDVQNLAYLSSMQALADIKNLLQFIKSQPQFQRSKVVVFGGSYPGNLAAWARQQYPELVDAAHSSSGPVLAKADFYEYLEVVGKSIRQYSEGCYNRIAQTFQRYDQLIKSPQGIEQLKREANICQYTDMISKDNQHLLFYDKINDISRFAQVGRLNEICQYGDFKPNNNISGNWNANDCHDADINNRIQQYKQYPVETMVPWTYQMCTEFGYVSTTRSNNHPFTDNVPVDLYDKLCSGIFGNGFNLRRMEEEVRKTNARYGGQTPRVDKVVFVHGDIDPWHPLGVLRDLSSEAPARVIRGAAHCSDLASDESDTNRERVAITHFAKQKLRQWIGSY